MAVVRLMNDQFHRGERYRLPSGRVVQVMRGNYETKRQKLHCSDSQVICRYLKNGEIRPPGREQMHEVSLEGEFLMRFGVRV